MMILKMLRQDDVPVCAVALDLPLMKNYAMMTKQERKKDDIA
jgi:hypothetical protein